ncbi:MAG: hypothetical protein E7A63_17755 [Clostridium butyricum]|nr:hypothetical protein [Clostridium butyricum]
MELKEYMREIKLMKKQNFTEYDMYSVIASLMREGANIKELSLRDVSKRWGRTNRGRIFYGLSSVPDFAVLDVDFENSENWIDDINNVYGCVEIKGINNTLPSIQKIIAKIKSGKEITIDDGQLLGEVLWYKKVLYTNGLVWKYLEWNEDKDSWENIKALVQNRINKENKEEEPSEWYLSDKIDLDKIEIKETSLITLSEEDTTEDEWKHFIEELQRIKWH